MKKYHYLRQRLAEYGIDTTYLAEQLSRSHSYTTKCLCGAISWNLDEVYQIMEIINEPHSRLHIVFPKGGVAVNPSKALADVSMADFLAALIKGA